MLMALIWSIVYIVPAIAIMLLPALVAAYGAKFVDVVCYCVWLFFLPITWPVKKLYSDIKNLLTEEEPSTK